MKKDILVTGVQPTGPMHIGNYVGPVRNLVNLQNAFRGRCLVFVADYHSLSEDYEPKKKQEQVLMLAAELLAAGLDPKKVTLYVQSDVPEVTELAWIFNTLTPISFLERMTQFKDKAERQRSNINVGLFDYPVLQAADILLPKATTVPVGADQVQHVELSRDVARFFNRKYGETFPEPKALLTETPRVMSLADPSKKMSKSVPGSFISICDSPEEIKKKMRSAVTDVGPKEEGMIPPFANGRMSPGVTNLMTLLREFGTSEDARRVEAAYRDGSIRYVDLKDLIAARIAEHFVDFRKKRASLLKNPAKVRSVLKRGGSRVRTMTRATMTEVQKKTGLR